MAIEVNATLDGNKFIEQIKKGGKEFWSNASIDSAVIMNDTDNDVTFFVYNYIDTVYLVSAMKVRVAAHIYGTVAASGKLFKILPNDVRGDEFLVAPQKAYIYKGPGKSAEEVKVS